MSNLSWMSLTLYAIFVLAPSIAIAFSVINNQDGNKNSFKKNILLISLYFVFVNVALASNDIH